MRIFICTVVVGVSGLVALAQQTDPKNAAGRPAFFTASQAARGKLAYERGCVDCHGSTLDNGEFGGPPLRGAGFLQQWAGRTVADLYSHTKISMPADRPGSLTDQTCADLLAFILDANGFPAGDNELPTDPKAQALMGLKVD